MARNYYRSKVEQLLADSDVAIGGNRPWDIRVHNNKFYARTLTGGSLALGESYVEGWWDCECLDEFFDRVLRARLDTMVKTLSGLPRFLKSALVNLQSHVRASKTCRYHYDIGNDLYRRMLDRLMIYSCGYWENSSTLDEAQEAKLDLVCRKLHLQPGMKLLDIGCGWGGTARFAAERYRAAVLGVTLSEEQVRYGKELCRGLPVKISLRDYRDLSGTFDRVLSIGMFEHVGRKNYQKFMRKVRSLLKEDGLFLLQTIGGNKSVFITDPWIDRYIFPDSLIPSARQISSAIEGVFVLEDWQSFGADYDRTLMSWFGNFDEHWDALRTRYDERFYRMWKYYLLSCAGSFRARVNQLWQIVLSPAGVPGGYRAPRVWKTEVHPAATIAT